MAPKAVKKAAPAAPAKEQAAAKVKVAKKTTSIVKTSGIHKAKHQITVVKRQGGTVRFAKKIRMIRKKKDSGRKLLRKIAKRRMDKKSRMAAIKAVEGKTDKNGKKILPVLKKEHKYDVKKMRKFYKTQLAPRTLPSKNLFSDMNLSRRRRIAHLRKSITPGTVCILLAGKYKGRRVVFLKQLQRSGLCLVSGPFKVNHVPLRRMNQNYMIATSVKINMEGVKVPKYINDYYFKREKVYKKKKSGEDEEIFQKKRKAKPRVNDRRREDQKIIDRQIVHAIKKGENTKAVLRYLSAKFAVMGRRYPHTLKF